MNSTKNKAIVVVCLSFLVLIFSFQNFTVIPAPSSTLVTQTADSIDSSLTKNSDILFSHRSGQASDGNADAVYNVSQSFYSTKLVWHYATAGVSPTGTPSVFTTFKNNGLPVQCSLLTSVQRGSSLFKLNTNSCKIANLPTGQENFSGVCLNINGQPVNAVKGTNNLYPTDLAPDISTTCFRDLVKGYMLNLKNIGCDYIQQDNPYMLNTSVNVYSGCYGNESMDAFNSFLADTGKSSLLRGYLNYRELIKSSYPNIDPNDVRATMQILPTNSNDYLLWVEFINFSKSKSISHFTELKNLAGSPDYWNRPVSFSFNQGPFIKKDGSDWDTGKSWLNPAFNQSVTEISKDAVTPNALKKIVSSNLKDQSILGGAGMKTVFTLSDPTILTNKQLIAGSYAIGAHSIVPWDVYTGPTTPRFYGSLTDFEPYFRFINQNKAVFDEPTTELSHYIYNPAVTSNGSPVSQDLTESLLIKSVETAGPVQVVARGTADINRLQTILHVVNWSSTIAVGTSANFKITLDQSIFRSEIESVQILRPGFANQSAPVTYDSNKNPVIEAKGINVWAILKINQKNRTAVAGVTITPVAEQQIIDFTVTSLNNYILSHYKYKLGLAATTNCAEDTALKYSSSFGVSRKITNAQFTTDGFIMPIGIAKLCLIGRIDDLTTLEPKSDMWQNFKNATEIVWDTTRLPVAGPTTPLNPSVRSFSIKVKSMNKYVLSHYMFKAGLESKIDCTTTDGYSKNFGIDTLLNNTLVNTEMPGFSSLPVGSKIKLCLRGRIEGVYVIDSWQSFIVATELRWSIL